MINPVNNNLPNEYQAGTSRTSNVDNNEHFSLNSALNNQAANSDDSGVIYEPSEKKKVSAESSASKNSDSFESSLNRAIVRQNKAESNEEAFNEELKSIWNSVKGFFSKLFNNLKAIFGNIWDSKPIGEGVSPMKNNSSDSDENAVSASVPITQADNSEENSAFQNETSVTDGSSNEDTSVLLEEFEKSRDEKIQKALSTGNKEEFRALISDDGRRVPARSTNILTTYDSKGKLVNIDPSDENKILHGNRGVKKL